MSCDVNKRIKASWCHNIKKKLFRWRFLDQNFVTPSPVKMPGPHHEKKLRLKLTNRIGPARQKFKHFWQQKFFLQRKAIKRLDLFTLKHFLFHIEKNIYIKNYHLDTRISLLKILRIMNQILEHGIKTGECHYWIAFNSLLNQFSTINLSTPHSLIHLSMLILQFW